MLGFKNTNHFSSSSSSCMHSLFQPPTTVVVALWPLTPPGLPLHPRRNSWALPFPTSNLRTMNAATDAASHYDVSFPTSSQRHAATFSLGVSWKREKWSVPLYFILFFFAFCVMFFTICVIVVRFVDVFLLFLLFISANFLLSLVFFIVSCSSRKHGYHCHLLFTLLGS